MPQQRGERADMGRPAEILRLIACESGNNVVGQRHDVEAFGPCRRLQGVDGLIFAVACAEPQSEVVAALVGERLQEEGAQRRTVAMTASGSELPSLVTVMV
ncbi:hypothetical protein ABGN05_24045 [Aquibium sp. LZ166]|jgi:hypothetical protein|uniref:Uncharacterized protein n=1 Tax=Aquibium pacificus TaxID=3153579 RepID=A0ABV3SPJ8_9HYPH